MKNQCHKVVVMSVIFTYLIKYAFQSWRGIHLRNIKLLVINLNKEIKVHKAFLLL